MQTHHTESDEKEEKRSLNDGARSTEIATTTVGGIYQEGAYPTDEQRATLRRVPAGININIFAIALIEFCER